MRSTFSDWYESEDEEEWDWEGGQDFGDSKRKSPKLKSYYIQFKDHTTHSVLIDAISEREAISQVVDEYFENESTSDVSILSVIEVDDEEE
tara:strand:+ start:801 stop:1073 length:273 start_codon:yes stop_codon:yes gene_type:complete